MQQNVVQTGQIKYKKVNMEQQILVQNWIRVMLDIRLQKR